MKPEKIIIGVCALCFALTAFQNGLSAEEPLIVLVREVWEWNTGAVYIYYYDANGDLIERIVEENGEEIYSGTFSYDYDEMGRKSMGYLEDSDGDTAVYTYTYNEDDQMVMEKWQWADSESGAFTAYYEYNDNNDVVEYIVESDESEELVYSYSVSYEYDEEGRKTQGFLEDSYNETAVISYEYEELPVIE
jgi:YD repeat-containing protein